jgi:hypothetical protein
MECSRNGTTVPPPVVSLVEGTATPISSEQRVYSLLPTQGPCQRAPVSDPSHAELSSAVPAPIVADPSVPDPVPGGSSTPTHTPVITDSLNASGLSIIPPAFLRVIDLDSPQISGVSGLFTPAQRSEGGTPVQLEDDAAEAPTNPQDGADKGPATASIPLRPDDDPSPIELIAGHKDGGNAEDKACVDDLIEPSQLVAPNERHVGVGTVGIDTQTPVVEAVESADKTSDELSRIPLKSPEHSSVPDPSGERLLKSPSLAGGDEDADGEADPDFSYVHGAKILNQTIAHQPDDEVTFNKSIRDTLRPKVTTLRLESRPTR